MTSAIVFVPFVSSSHVRLLHVPCSPSSFTFFSCFTSYLVSSVSAAPILARNTSRSPLHIVSSFVYCLSLSLLLLRFQSRFYLASVLYVHTVAHSSFLFPCLILTLRHLSHRWSWGIHLLSISIQFLLYATVQ